MNQFNRGKSFRPPSLSIVTVTPEIQKTILDLYNSKLHLLVQNSDLEDNYESDDEPTKNFNNNNNSSSNNVSNYESSDHEQNQEQTKIDKHRELLEQRRASLKKVRDIVYGNQNDAETEEEDEFDDQRYYVRPEKSINRNKKKQSQTTTNRNEVILSPNLYVLNHKSISPTVESLEGKYPNSKQMPTAATTYHVKHRNKLDTGSHSSNLEPSTPTRHNKPPSILKQSSSKDDYGDDISIGVCSINTSNDNYLASESYNQSMNEVMNTRMVKLLSVMYAVLVVVIGAIITVGDMNEPVNDMDHLYSIVITTIGICFLVFVHYDVQKHKRFVMRWQKRRREKMESTQRSAECDTASVTTAVIFNRTYSLDQNDDDEEMQIDEKTQRKLNSYRFLTGKHSGSFYLKIGMTLFCMGSIVHQGVSLALQIHFLSTKEDKCSNPISFIVYLIRCVSAFYQLYIAFKYSNLIINRNHYIVRFGLMHLVGSSLSFWFSTIIEEAMDGYIQKVKTMHIEHNAIELEDNILLKKTIEYNLYCSNSTLANFESLDSMPYLYPFSIEYNIILASVWYIVWTNVGNNDPFSQLHHVREEINKNRHTGTIDVNYRSNVTINADCHASNMGMFGGFFSLLMIMTTIIIFFSTIKTDAYRSIGIAIYTGQFGFLTVCSLVAIPLAFRHTRSLNVVKSHHLDSAATAMDDLLLLVPLPFYYVHHLLCIYSELSIGSANNILMALSYSMHLAQVTCQTPFIVDGIRRCSNDRKLRYRKPGKGLITFALIINVALWILITFEIKSVDKYHSMPKYFGKFVWMIILDTCLPLMLFYRFHSSVCLSDMWKHAYEKDEH